MGQVARSTIENSDAGNDAVLGFIPESMSDLEVSGQLLGRTRVVKDMHERKAAMAEAADAFIALPGGCAPLHWHCLSSVHARTAQAQWHV